MVMSGWFLLASAIVQYQRKIKLLKIKIKKKYLSQIGGMANGNMCFVRQVLSCVIYCASLR